MGIHERQEEGEEMGVRVCSLASKGLIARMNQNGSTACIVSFTNLEP